MHIVPGAMILYIYWPSDKNQVDLKNSLLISASDNKLYWFSNFYISTKIHLLKSFKKDLN